MRSQQASNCILTITSRHIWVQILPKGFRHRRPRLVYGRTRTHDLMVESPVPQPLSHLPLPTFVYKEVAIYICAAAKQTRILLEFYYFLMIF